MIDQSERYFIYFKSIDPDKWHRVSDYAPSNPDRFLEYLEMLPFAGRMITDDKLQFKIIGKL